MFKHIRLIIKSVKDNLKIKRVLLATVIIATLFYTYQFIRLKGISKLKDFVEIYERDLNDALKNIPQLSEASDSWKTPDLDGSRIFSAYLETRSEVIYEADSQLIYNNTFWGYIRVVGIIPRELESVELTCTYKYVNVNKLNETYFINKRSIDVELVAEHESFGMKYCAAFVLCPLPNPEETLSKLFELPFQVTVTNLNINNDDKTKFVTIRYPKNGWNDRKPHDQLEFSVCVQPLHHQFSKALELITFIEYYRMMGVKHFTFYPDSITPQVNDVLNYYHNQNLATILKWKLPNIYIFERTLRVDGIFAALNDCLYRSTTYHGSKYTIGVDVDEFIVPRKHSSLVQLMKYLNDEQHQNGAWIFRNAFYYLMYPDDDDDSVTMSPDAPHLQIHFKTKRWKKFNPSHERSKYIVEGDKVVELGNHQTWKMRPIFSAFYRRYAESVVDTEIASSNHYRMCETKMEECWQRKMIVDRTTHRFTKELGERVKTILKEIFS